MRGFSDMLKEIVEKERLEYLIKNGPPLVKKLKLQLLINRMHSDWVAMEQDEEI